MSVTVRFAGSGDAFGSGGRAQACIVVSGARTRLLVDCGASSLVALRRAEIDPATIDAVLVSHFHGDHFGGIPFLLLDAQFARPKRERPLVVAGPPGVEGRVRAAFEALFTGSFASAHRAVDVRYVELGALAAEVGEAAVRALPVEHTDGVQAHGLRLVLEGRTIAYSGDTAWCDSLVELADGADLFICECYSWDREIPKHLSHATLVSRRSELRAKKVVLTHLGPEALSRRTSAAFAVADDRTTIRL